MFLLLTSVLLIGLTACGNKEPEYSLEFIEGKTVTIEDNEYVGAFFNFTNNGDATTYCPNDNEMKIGFETSKLVNLQSKGIIYLLESKIRSDNSSTALLGVDNYSLEHLMPKKWRNNWGACATEDDAKKRDSLLLTLGNLAIIPQTLNASIRDAAWNVKKAGKGQNKPGLLLCASGLYTLHDVLQKNDWNEHEIENRAEWLLANAQNIWKI